MRDLGVGLIYWPELAPLFDAPGLVNVLELEPQTIWGKHEAATGPSYRVNAELLNEIVERPHAKLLHGVGQPVGGTVDDPLDYLSPWALCIDALDPPWISEHLSFNRVRVGESVLHTGLLLPPKQSTAAIEVAAHNISRFSANLRRPVAVETGVNYLQRSADELSDGDYFAAVAREADCGLVLDMHNLWCNQRNGRDPIAETLESLPLDRVWEIHLAGGMDLNGFRLDAHSDLVPPELMELTAALIAKLPALGAITFEILPGHLERIGLDQVARQLESLHDLWALRPHRSASAPPRIQDCSRNHRPPSAASLAESAAWESQLLTAVRGELIGERAPAFLHADPAIAILRRLIREGRLSNIARALKYSMTLLLLHLGAGAAASLLDEYCRASAPDPFPTIEANQFAIFLRARPERIVDFPYLAEVLAFEHALVQATLFGSPAEVTWSTDPVALFDALDTGRIPGKLPQRLSTMQAFPTH